MDSLGNRTSLDVDSQAMELIIMGATKNSMTVAYYINEDNYAC